MSTEQLAVVSGAAVGIAGIAAGVLTSVLDRRHQRRTAREARLFERRAAIYLELLAHLHDVSRDLQGANPVAEASLDPASRERQALLRTQTEEERTEMWKQRVARNIEMTASVAAFGSEPLRVLLRQFFDAEERFTESWSGDPEALDQAAADTADTLRQIEARIRSELDAT